MYQTNQSRKRRPYWRLDDRTPRECDRSVIHCVRLMETTGPGCGHSASSRIDEKTLGVTDRISTRLDLSDPTRYIVVVPFDGLENALQNDRIITRTTDTDGVGAVFDVFTDR